MLRSALLLSSKTCTYRPSSVFTSTFNHTQTLFAQQIRQYAQKIKKSVMKRLIYRKGISLQRDPLPSSSWGIFAGGNFLSSKGQLECLRVTAKREAKKKAIVRIKAFPNVPVTKKAAGVRMGKGKGPIQEYKARLRIGEPLVELDAGKEKTLLKIMKKLQYKLPVPIYGYNKDTGKKYYLKKKK
jgi:large subunit ribosomal protein L16